MRPSKTEASFQDGGEWRESQSYVIFDRYFLLSRLFKLLTTKQTARWILWEQQSYLHIRDACKFQLQSKLDNVPISRDIDDSLGQKLRRQFHQNTMTSLDYALHGVFDVVCFYQWPTLRQSIQRLVLRYFCLYWLANSARYGTCISKAYFPCLIYSSLNLSMLTSSVYNSRCKHK